MKAKLHDDGYPCVVLAADTQREAAFLHQLYEGMRFTKTATVTQGGMGPAGSSYLQMLDLMLWHSDKCSFFDDGQCQCRFTKQVDEYRKAAKRRFRKTKEPA